MIGSIFQKEIWGSALISIAWDEPDVFVLLVKLGDGITVLVVLLLIKYFFKSLLGL